MKVNKMDFINPIIDNVCLSYNTRGAVCNGSNKLDKQK